MGNDQPTLQLWGDGSVSGDPVEFDAPETDTELVLPTSTRVHAATNNSGGDVEFFDSSDASGDPVETLRDGQTAVYPLGHDVGSIRFVY